MSNKTTTSILEYAEVHRDFSMDDLFAYLHEKVGISKSSLSWYLFKAASDVYKRQVDMDSRVFFVKNLVSEAPLQKVSDIPMPTLEKLLVDILRDADFFYLQGSESEHIFENAFNLYAVNRNRLFRYAGRRKAKEEILSILENLNIK